MSDVWVIVLGPVGGALAVAAVVRFMLWCRES